MKPLLPLLPETTPTRLVAWRHGQGISQARFLQDVSELAARLPAERPLLNLCRDRYLFAVALFAAIVRGNRSLLPNAATPENLVALQAEHPQLLCLNDQAEAPAGLPHLRVAIAPGTEPESAPAMPRVPAEQIIAHVYTSGSTGVPQGHIKRFGPLMQCVRAGAELLWQYTGGPCAVLGTVPFQHMYGLESSVILPLVSGGLLCDAQPYFPADIATALAALPAPRFLVTTPFHLRTLLDAEIALPPLAGLLSATAPLARELAERAEARLDAPLLEIYGSTETGQIATRRSTREEVWSLYEGVELLTCPEGTLARSPFMEHDIVMGDVLECLDARHFHFLGRGADLINVAGKRNSLGFLNNVILRIPGVRDAAFCLPGEHETARLAAFVVAPGVAPREILNGLRAWIDPVFLPRPLIFLDSLPRNATGKIPAAEMARLIATHIGDARA